MINKLIKVFFLTWLLVTLLYGNSLAVTLIELKESVCLSGDEIYLKDIATLSDNSLNNVYMGKLPLPGKKRCFSQGYVKLRILQAKIKEEDFKITSDNEVEVIASSQKLNMEEVTQIARMSLLEKIDSSKRIEIEPFGTIKDIILPAGKVEYQVSAVQSQNFRNQVYIPVDIKINGTKYRTIKVGFRIHRFANVIITTRSLPGYYILTFHDVRMEEREVTYINPIPLEEVIGKRLKTAVPEGKILTYDLIETPPLIKRGDVVTIKREDEFLSISAKGMAKQDGRLGDKIQIENTISKKIITGVVEDDKTVLVK